MTGEIFQKRVQQQSVGAAFQISKRQVHEPDGTFLIRLLTGYQPAAGVKQNFTRVVARGYEAGILKIAILVAPELHFESSTRRNGGAILGSGSASFCMERIVLAGWDFQLTDNCIGAGDLAPLNRLVAKLVVTRVIHARQVRQPGTIGRISAIQRESAGIVDEHDFPAVRHKTVQSRDEEITR